MFFSSTGIGTHDPYLLGFASIADTDEDTMSCNLDAGIQQQF